MMDSLPDGADVAAFLSRPDLAALAEEHVPYVARMARAYCGGHGFSGDGADCEEDIAAVIVAATARLVTNPAQVESEGADGYSVRGGFHAWSLPELGVLHRYRRRTA
jgi:hypothetical protein